MTGESYYRELLGGKRTSVRDRLLLFVLRIAAVPYAGVLRLRSLAYGSGLLPSRKLPRPVISVGNLTVGGTGKTPTVAFLAHLLMTAGKRVVVLSRGYGGSCEGETRVVANGSDILLTPAEAGDEPVLLASQLPGLMVVIGPDRFRAGQLAMEQLNPDLFILDDGYQHMRLCRDLNILLLDCRQPFGNGRTLPAGFLREPLSALQRADLVIFTRCRGDRPAPGIIPPGKPYCTADHSLSGFVPLGGGEQRSLSDLRGEKGMAFAGIAEPAAFFAALEEEGLRLITTLTFPDHCGYGEEELAALVRLRGAARPGYLITTAKDGVKLANHREKLGNCLTAVLELRLHDEKLLRQALAKII